MSYYTKLIIPTLAAVTLSTGAIATIPVPQDTTVIQAVKAKTEVATFPSFLEQVQQNSSTPNVTILADGSIRASDKVKISFSSPMIASVAKPKSTPKVVDKTIAAGRVTQDKNTQEKAGSTPASSNVTDVKTKTSDSFTASESSTTGKIVELAHHYLGVNYVWGGVSPVSGWDCSGFTQFVYGQAGVSLTRVNQWEGKQRVALSEARAGDLVVQGGGTHVGIYLGNGRMISALNPTQGTMEHSIDIMPAEFYRVY